MTKVSAHHNTLLQNYIAVLYHSQIIIHLAVLPLHLKFIQS